MKVICAALSAALSCAACAHSDSTAPDRRVRFDAAYQAAHRDRIEIVVPEVYEMVNVAMALTPAVQAQPGRVPETPYRERVLSYFAPVGDHPLVTAISTRLETAPILGYIAFKLDAYAFEFDASGQIVRSLVYDRISDDPENSLLALMPQLQSFAEQSNFRAFYAENGSHYQEQIAFFEETLNAPGMLAWLRAEFPGVRSYDSIKVVLSPLAGNIQNQVAFEDAGFREMQAHVNFPYRTLPDLSESGNTVWRGTQLFGELNHGFINPAAEPYAGQIAAAISDRADWTTEANADAYPDDQAVFNEYMNFALISLYHDARMSAEDAVIAAGRIDYVMGQRGFTRFAGFNAMLRRLYRERRPAETVADLYPRIVAWVETQ